MPSERQNFPCKIVFFGEKGVGKNTFINAVANSPLTTPPLTRFTRVTATIGDTAVELIDSPGFGPVQLIQDATRNRISEWISDNIVSRRCRSAFVYLYSFAQTYNYEYVLENIKTIYDLAQENGIRMVVLISNKSNLAEPEAIEFWWEKHREDSEIWGKGVAHFDFKGEGNIAKAVLKRILDISEPNVGTQDPIERTSIDRRPLSLRLSLRDRMLWDIERDSISRNSVGGRRYSSDGNDSRDTSNRRSRRHPNANDETSYSIDTSPASNRETVGSSESMSYWVGPAIEVAGVVASSLIDEYRTSRAHERAVQLNRERFLMTAAILGLKTLASL